MNVNQETVAGNQAKLTVLRGVTTPMYRQNARWKTLTERIVDILVLKKANANPKAAVGIHWIQIQRVSHGATIVYNLFLPAAVFSFTESQSI